MKIIDIYKLPRQSSYSVEEVLRLKDWGRSVFPTQNTMGVNWALLKKNVPGLEAFYVETELNKFYTLSLNQEKFILVNYDKVMQIFTPYCTNPYLYESMMKLLIAHSDLSYCYFAANENQDILMPNDDGYYIECDD